MFVVIDEARRIRVRLDADYFASPLWIYEGLISNYVSTPLDWFPLSTQLKARLAAWAGTYDQLRETDYEFPTKAAERDFDREGRRLLVAVREELGSHYEVEYLSRD